MAAVAAKLSLPSWLPSEEAMSLEVSEAFVGFKTQPLRCLPRFALRNACVKGDIAPKLLSTGVECEEFGRMFI